MKHYKPDPETYLMASNLLDLRHDEVMLVAEPEFGTPVSPLLPPESVINPSFLSTERLFSYTLILPQLAFYREPV